MASKDFKFLLKIFGSLLLTIIIGIIATILIQQTLPIGGGATSTGNLIAQLPTGLSLLTLIAIASLNLFGSAYLAMLIPLLFLFAYVIYKFKEEGIISVLLFVALIAIVVGSTGLYINLVIGIALVILALLLSKKWGFWSEKPPSTTTTKREN